MEGVKSLDMQHRRILRRKGSGMLGELTWELGRPPYGLQMISVVTRPISGGTVKWNGKPYRGIGGVHSTDDGKDNKTFPEGRDPALLMRPKKVRARECRRLITP